MTSANVTLAEADFNVVPRTFKSRTWKTPSRRHKPAKAVMADEQRRLQAIVAQHHQQYQDTLEQEQGKNESENNENVGEKKEEEEGEKPNETKAAEDAPPPPPPPPVFHASYSAIEAPPSIRPRKWWCDITGLEGKYRSVRHGLRYHNAEVYGIVQGMAPGVDQQYLELRNANVVLR